MSCLSWYISWSKSIKDELHMIGHKTRIWPLNRHRIIRYSLRSGASSLSAILPWFNEFGNPAIAHYYSLIVENNLKAPIHYRSLINKMYRVVSIRCSVKACPGPLVLAIVGLTQQATRISLLVEYYIYMYILINRWNIWNHCVGHK